MNLIRNAFFIGIIVFISTSCNKDRDYKDYIPSIVDFTIFENVGDTLLPTDTSYALRLISFQCTKEIIHPKWTIGTNGFTSSSRSVSLTFTGRDEIDVNLTGHLSNNKDTVISKHLTILEPHDIISPLVGEYLGSNLDSKSDTFRVSIEYWYGDRYPWWSDGAYSINNLPKNYEDRSQNFNGFLRPEIAGIVASTGYKNMSFNKSGNILAAGIKGYASLTRGKDDTLKVNYQIIDTAKYNQNNAINYINKMFIGVKIK